MGTIVQGDTPTIPLIAIPSYEAGCTFRHENLQAGHLGVSKVEANSMQ